EGLSSQGVVNVRRILTRKGTATIPTKHVILTFSSTVLPSSIKAGYLNIRVRPYIPYPLRCFKCQKFGHSQTACRGKQICSRCASGGHSYSSCQSKPNCANCHQAHESASKSCPQWIEEKKIQEVRVKKKLTYSEARKLFQSESATSYAQITKVSKPAMSTQTDESLTQLPCPPLPPQGLAFFRIKAGYLNIRVRPYIPYPLRCFKCQKFGHSQTACRGKQICSRCASGGHSYSSCQSKPNCANCHQAHESASKSCPQWIEEKKIQEVRVKKKLTYSEARKLFQSESATSYAQITKVSKPAMSTQTDESLTQLPCPPLPPQGLAFFR
ncbi:hypothetical protein AVEN_105262-1, partial [Araneus ventricosus]